MEDTDKLDYDSARVGPPLASDQAERDQSPVEIIAAQVPESPELQDREPPFLRPSFDHHVSRIFLGPDGLRPIWRLFLYLAMSRALFLLLNAALNFIADRSNVLQLWIELASECVLLLAAMVPALAMARLESRSPGDYGLPAHHTFGRLFWTGALWGIAALSVLMLTLDGAGAFTFGRFSLHGFRILKCAAFWGGFFLVVAFAEEFLLRGYTQFTLSQATGFWPAAVLLSIAFGAIHFLNPGEAWQGILAAAGIGFFFCLTLWRTGSLWFAVGFHAAWDWGESYLYSVPDSGGVSPGHLLKSSLHGPKWLTGGSVGPEGSVLIFVLLVLLWIVFDRVYPEIKYSADRPIKAVAA
jgi:membrane protease YdiL (CAAX protease family)